MEKVLVIGLGEVGYPLYEIIKESGEYEVYGLDTNINKMNRLDQKFLPNRFDIIHICIVCADFNSFVNMTVNYAKRFKPHLLIIESTVLPKTTSAIKNECGCFVVHSPIFGMHRGDEHMKNEMRKWTKIIGGYSLEAIDAAKEHFRKIGIRTHIVKSPLEAELIKLMETAYAGTMIAFFQDFHRFTLGQGADFEEIFDYISDIHRKTLNKPPWYPDVIEGHCIMQNIELILTTFESRFFNSVKESNEQRKSEVRGNKELKNEIMRLKKKCDDFYEELDCKK